VAVPRKLVEPQARTTNTIGVCPFHDQPRVSALGPTRTLTFGLATALTVLCNQLPLAGIVVS